MSNNNGPIRNNSDVSTPNQNNRSDVSKMLRKLQKRCAPQLRQVVSNKKRFITPFKSQGSNDSCNTEGEAKTVSKISFRSTASHSPRNTKSSLAKSKFKPPTMISSPTNPVSHEGNRKLSEAKEQLRRLKLVEYHRKHNDLETLAKLTVIWKEAGHKALHELHRAVSIEPKPTTTELLSNLRIPPEHIHCECDDI